MLLRSSRGCSCQIFLISTDRKTHPHVVGITLNDQCTAQKLIDVLGGTVKLPR